MRFMQCTIACLALFITAQSAPTKSKEPTAIVVAHPVKVIKYLYNGSDDGTLGYFKVKMKVDHVLNGKFQRRYFYAALLGHVRQDISLAQRWVAVIGPDDEDGMTSNLNRVQARYCFHDDTVAEFGLNERIGPSYRVPEYPDAACWQLRAEDQ